MTFRRVAAACSRRWGESYRRRVLTSASIRWNIPDTNSLVFHPIYTEGLTDGRSQGSHAANVGGDAPRRRLRGTGRGDRSRGRQPRPATGLEIALRSVHIVRYRDGREIETWALTDRLGLLQQLGVIPDGPPARRP